MLQLSLLPALVAPSFVPIHAPSFPEAPAPILCAEELSRALPNDAQGVLLVGELGAQLFGENAGQWAQFLRDERWFDILVTAAESEGEDGEALREGLALTHSALRGLRGGALCFEASEDDVRGVLRVDEGWMERLTSSFGELGDGLEATTCLGRPALTGPIEGGTGTLLVVDGGTHVFIAVQPDLDTATATIGALKGALEGALDGAAEDETERWWLTSDGRVDGASLEVFVNVGALMPADDLEELSALIGTPGVAYAAFGLGSGRASELSMSFDVGGGPLMDAVVSALMEADPALLSYVPEEFTGTVFGVDVLAAIEEGLAFAEETTPGASTDYDQGLEAITGLLGVDLEADLLAQLTGQILFMQPNALDASILEEDTMSESLLPVFALQVKDVEAVVGVLEALAEAAAEQGLEAEAAEVPGGSLWTFDPGLGVTIAVGAGSGFLVLGAEQGTVDVLARAVRPSEERALEPAIAALAGTLEGFAISAAPIAAMTEYLSSAQDLMATFAEDDEESALINEMMADLTAIVGDHLSGVLGSEARISSKRVSYRMLTR